jgi:hypothetical protein
MVQEKVWGTKLYAGFIFVLAMVSTLAIGAQSMDSRPNDLVVAVDVSGSMARSGAFKDVKAYLENEVLRPLLKPGDRFTLMLFGTAARVQASRTITGAGDVDAIVAAIKNLVASDGYTDLGMAVEVLEAAMQSHADGAFRPVAVFLTDGKNAPPPESPFSGKDLSIDERFSGAGQRIAKKGWFLYVIGLGEESDAATLAAAVEGSALVESSEALAAKPLEVYLKATAAAAEERADGAAGSSSTASAEAGGSADGTATGRAGEGSSAAANEADLKQSGDFPFGILAGAIIGAAALAGIAVALGRRKKKAD